MSLTPEQLAVIQAASKTASNWQQNYYNKKAFERSKDFYWEQWNANNEYNTPSAQRKRLEEGGFNPALMYNQSGGTGNATMTSGPEMQPPSVEPLPGGLEYSQIQLIKSQIDETNARAGLILKQQISEQYEANLKKLEGDLSAERRRELEIRNSKLEEMLDMQLEKDASIISKQTQDIAESKQRVAESKNRITIENLNYDLKKEFTEAQINQLEKMLEKMDAEISKMGLEGDYLEKLTELTGAKQTTEYIDQELKRLERDGYGKTSNWLEVTSEFRRFIKSYSN